MSGATTCPGCGLELPASGLTPDPRRNASPECWRLYGEVQGFELNHIELARDYISWRWTPTPRSTRRARGAATVFEVAAAGAMVGSVAGHAEAVRDWAASVWQAWAPQHPEVAALADRLFR